MAFLSVILRIGLSKLWLLQGLCRSRLRGLHVLSQKSLVLEEREPGAVPRPDFETTTPPGPTNSFFLQKIIEINEQFSIKSTYATHSSISCPHQLIFCWISKKYCPKFPRKGHSWVCEHVLEFQEEPGKAGTFLNTLQSTESSSRGREIYFSELPWRESVTGELPHLQSSGERCRRVCLFYVRQEQL